MKKLIIMLAVLLLVPYSLKADDVNVYLKTDTFYLFVDTVPKPEINLDSTIMDSSLCRVFGWFMDLDGQGMRGVKVKAYEQMWGILMDETRSDKNGFWIMYLVPGVEYKFEASCFQYGIIAKETIKIPNALFYEVEW